MGGRFGPALVAVFAAVAAAACDSDPTAQSPSTGTVEPATPAPVPPRIVALSKDGDVVVIDRETKQERIIAAFPPRHDPQVSAGSFRAVDVTALPDGRLLLATCCEPAAGHMYALTEEGRRLKEQDLFAEDAGHDGGTRVASGELVGLVIRPLSDLNSALTTISLSPDLIGAAPEDISWSPDAAHILFTIGGRLAVVEASAGSLAEAIYLDPPPGSHWSGAAYTRDGPVAVEQGGDLLHPAGQSRLLRVDPKTGESSELVATEGRITDLAVDPSGSYLLWVEGGRLRWSAGGESTTVPGDFIAAGWLAAAA